VRLEDKRCVSGWDVFWFGIYCGMGKKGGIVKKF
jgi:hypothetical protein